MFLQEVDKLLVARGAVVLSSLLLQRLLQDLLQHLRSVVVVERHVGDHVVVVQLGQLLVDQDSLAAAGSSDKHDRVADVDQQVQEVLDTDSLCKMQVIVELFVQF